MMTPMTETALLAFLDECKGRLVLTDMNKAAAEALAAKGILKITPTRRVVGQMGVMVGAFITRVEA